MKYLKALLHIIIVVLLTLITQVGGLVWITVFGYYKLRKSQWSKRKRLLAFSLVYLVIIFTVVPWISKIYGRTMLPVFQERLQPHNLGYVLLCRNYVSMELYETLQSIASGLPDLEKGRLTINYLDAGFPFIDGFPLLPHLSHNDGRKIDIAFVYNDENGIPADVNPSLTGYGVYVETANGSNPTLVQCENSGHWQYGYSKYFGWNVNESIMVNPTMTKVMIKRILKEPKTQKLFIEPHLIEQFELNKLNKSLQSKIRFHGCHAVRHDDHIHFQIH